MDKQEFKKRLTKLGERYQEKIDRLKDQGFKKFVDWEILRKMRVYLFGKDIDVESSVVEYNNFYTCIILESRVAVEESFETISVIVITPEDTEGSAYGKVDRILIPEYNNYLKEKENTHE